MYPEDVDPEPRCRLPLPRRDELDDAGQRIYDTLADPTGGTILGVSFIAGSIVPLYTAWLTP